VGAVSRGRGRREDGRALEESLDSPTARVPKEKGTSAIPPRGIGALRRSSSAILKPVGFSGADLRN
jgi:hypothetical protein